MARRRQERNEGLRALNRFGLGARIGEAEHIDDPRGWLEDQIAGRDAGATSGDPPVTAAEIGAALEARNELVSRVLPQTRNVPQSNQDMQAVVQRTQQALREIGRREIEWALGERVRTPRPFVERLVAFWSNHLCVSVAAKPLQVGPLAGLYEREAIRPHVLGRFEDLVLASAQHPAMLFYLDNAQSIGENSPAGRQAGRRGANRGLNENYARELLELHTLGVDGGYDQEDVVALARILTGWSVAGAGNAVAQRLVGRGAQEVRSDVPAFRFYPALHEPGDHTVLGTRYVEGGEVQGEAVIRDLCRHPSTARFVATKLVTHFVSDDPLSDDVDRVAGVFRETEGDLHAVSRELIHLDRAWASEERKFRTPQDWFVASLRALGADQFPPRLVAVLNQLRHPLWSPSSPKGYGDTRGDWADPDALMNRAELARTLAGTGGRRLPDAVALATTVVLSPSSGLVDFLNDETIDPGERRALALGGPDFQWR